MKEISRFFWVICFLSVFNMLSAEISDTLEGDIESVSGKRLVSIVNGIVSQHRPFYARVKMNVNGITHFCGAAVVGVTWVVTAAHCLIGSLPAEQVVELGDFTDSRSNTRRSVRVDKVFMSPLFRMNELGFPVSDIALLKLMDRVDPFMIIPLCPKSAEVDTILGSCGLGRTSPKIPHFLNPLRYFPKMLQEFHAKESFFLNSDIFHMIQCPQSNICTFPLTQGASLCTHDDGGPLYELKCGTNTPDCLYGVASYSLDVDGGSKEGCRGGSIFASVPYHFKWLMKCLIQPPDCPSL